MKEPGKKRIKLAQLLTEAGFETDPHDLWAVEGWERSSQRIDNDSARWEGAATTADLRWGSGALPVHLYSYHTMTELVRTGVSIEHSSHDIPLWYQVFPKKEGKQ